jgi:4-hydroxybenzoate polyprenyltransferase
MDYHQFRGFRLRRLSTQFRLLCSIPVALTIVFFYSLTKRFTWASHLFLGLALSLAPKKLGAWLAVSGSPIDLPELATPIFLRLGRALLATRASTSFIHSKTTHSTARRGFIRFRLVLAFAAALRFSSFFHICTVVFLAAVGLFRSDGSLSIGSAL